MPCSVSMERSTRPFRIARRRDFPQRAVFAARSAGALRRRARAAPRRARRAARAAAGPRDPPGAGRGAAYAALGAERGAVARGVRCLREPTAQSLWSALELRLRVVRIERRWRAGAAGRVAEKPWRILHLWTPRAAPALGERPLRDFGRCGRSPRRAVEGRGRDYDGPGTAPADRPRRRRPPADLVVCTGPDQLAMEESSLCAGPRSRARRPADLHPETTTAIRWPDTRTGSTNPTSRRALCRAIRRADSCGEICWPVITQGRIRSPS